MRKIMRYIVTMIILALFTVQIVFANGGPSFEQLYEQSHKKKQVVELIDQSNKDVDKQEICFRAKGKTIEQVPC